MTYRTYGYPWRWAMVAELCWRLEHWRWSRNLRVRGRSFYSLRRAAEQRGYRLSPRGRAWPVERS